MWNELNLREIKAKGWEKAFLENQASGLTGEIGNVGEPFSLNTWGTPDVELDLQSERFLGGVNSLDDSWVPYEQNGYWIDGMIRAGHLTDNEKLVKQAGQKIYPVIENIDKDGFLGPGFLKDGLTWAHAVYFRALIAEYTATQDARILESLKRHFLRRPLKEAYRKQDLRIISVRNVAEIETALWIYEKTGDERFLTMSEESYQVFNELFSDDSSADVNSQMHDITLPGMLGNRKVQRNHGVTYCEICKLAALLYKYTGKEEYKTAAVNAFDKLYRDQMLVDGVPSSTEYLNGNEDSQAMHETCVIADMTWALGYLYMITGDAKYGDWVENAVFNAGLGAVDDDFTGNQYFSCPNQAVANDCSNHVKFFRGKDWMSYAPKKFLACCAGNVHRIMPNFVCRSWMQDQDTLAVFTYTASEINVTVGGMPVRIEEITDYPFENTVRFHIHADSPLEFGLLLRKPAWAVDVKLSVNGRTQEADFANNTYRLFRMFREGDEVIISFTDQIELIENAGGVSVKKGAILYALPIQEEVVTEGLRELKNPRFPHYSLYPKSQWNYGLCVDKKDEFVFENGQTGEEPWRGTQNGLTITVKVREVKNWKLQYVKKVLTREKPRERCHWAVREAVFTPKVRPIRQAQLGEERTVTLVPYGTTRLRIAIFPIVGD